MIFPYSYHDKTQETLLLGLACYDELMEWHEGRLNRVYHLLNVFYDREEALERIISDSASYSYTYAYFIINGRFVLGERSISENSDDSYQYALNVIKGRFELGERSISDNAELSYLYAYNIIKGRFELGEDVIMRSRYKNQYLSLINQ